VFDRRSSCWAGQRNECRHGKEGRNAAPAEDAEGKIATVNEDMLPTGYGFDRDPGRVNVPKRHC
jgi:hypothetical protein